MKSVHIRSNFGPYFPAFGLNTKRYSVLSISLYSVQMPENTDQNNSEYGHFLRSVRLGVIYLHYHNLNMIPKTLYTLLVIADKVKNLLRTLILHFQKKGPFFATN